MRGTKADMGRVTPEQAREQWPAMQAGSLGELGATERLIGAIKSGEWQDWIHGVDRFVEALNEYGTEAVHDPKIRVGTVHSAKGMEADNVMILTTVSQPVYEAAQSAEGADEEARTKYVAVTRARHRVVRLEEKKPAYRWNIE